MNAPVHPRDLSVEERIAPLFAGPHCDGWADMAEVVSRKWMLRSRDRIHAALEQAGETRLASQWMPALAPRFSPWRPEFSMAARAAAAGHPAMAVLQHALACDPGSRSFELTAQCDREACLYLDGSLIPIRGECTLQVSADRIQLTSEGAQRRFRLDRNVWTADRPEQLPGWVCERQPGPAPRILISAALPSSQGVFPWPEQRVMRNLAQGRGPDESDPPGCADIRAALELLATAAPGYREWVAAAIDTILVLHGESSSSSDYPGVVVLGAQASRLDACEAIVMQAAPQYFTRLVSIIELVEPGAEEIHYVPERRSYVTTRHLLAHAHEKANLIVMLAKLAPECAEAQRRLALREMQFAVEFGHPLHSARSLTPAGVEFWSSVQQLAAPAARNPQSH